MIKSSQISIYGLSLINSMLSNKYYKVTNNTTLNEKFNIMKESHTPKGNLERPVHPLINYFVIGVGGNNTINNSTGYSYSQHRAIDAALFKHVPFALKPIDNDIPSLRRMHYRLRKQIDIDGKSYYAYYAKKIHLIDYRSYNLLINRINGVDTLSVMNPEDDRYLNPIPFNKPVDKDTVLETDSVINRFKIEFSLTTEERDDILEALKILGYDKDTRLTELGICHGHETYNAGYLECIDTQISYFIDIDLNLSLEMQNNKTFKRDIELGGSEPYYK